MDGIECSVESHAAIRSALGFYRRFTSRPDVREIMERLARE